LPSDSFPSTTCANFMPRVISSELILCSGNLKVNSKRRCLVQINKRYVCYLWRPLSVVGPRRDLVILASPGGYHLHHCVAEYSTQRGWSYFLSPNRHSPHCRFNSLIAISY
jgi:hypothetical protein